MVPEQRGAALAGPLARRRAGRVRGRAVTPRVTVLIGAYDNAATLPQAIGSSLGQTGSELEQLGIARSLNLGIEQALAPLIAVQDADDWSEPQRLERQLAVLDSTPEVAVVGGLMREVDEQGREL